MFGNYARHWGFPIIYTYFALKCVLLIIFCSECYHFQSLGPYNMLQHMEEGWKPTYKAHNELESLWSFLFKTDLVYFWSFFVLGFTPWKLILFVSSLLSHDGQYLNPLCANFHLTYIKTLYLTGWFLGTPIKMHKTVDLVVTIYERVLPPIFQNWAEWRYISADTLWRLPEWIKIMETDTSVWFL